jgi:hypothetical protein
MSTSEGKKLNYNDFQSLLKVVFEDNAQILDKSKREYETKLYDVREESIAVQNEVAWARGELNGIRAVITAKEDTIIGLKETIRAKEDQIILLTSK